MSIAVAELAQIGFPSPDDILKAYLWSAVLSACWGVLLLASVVVVSVGTFRFRRRSGKVMVGLGGTIVTSLLYVGYVAVVPPHRSLVLDLSASRLPPTGNWMSNGIDGEMLCFQGRVDALVKLPNGNAFDDRATLLVIDRRDGQVSRLFVQKSGMSREEAFQLTAKYIRAWGFDPKNFDQWCADRRQGKRELYGEDMLFYSYKNKSYPSLALELRASLDTWALNLTVFWPKENAGGIGTP